MTPEQHERQQQLRTIRIRALEALRDHGPLRPLEVARWAGIGRRWIGAILGWALPHELVAPKGGRYSITPTGEYLVRRERGPQRTGRW